MFHIHEIIINATTTEEKVITTDAAVKKFSAQTSVPDWVMTYCRQLAEVHYKRKLNGMYIHMIECFLSYEPWNASPRLDWRVARIHRASVASQKAGADPGWVPMNMLLPSDLVERVRHIIDAVNSAGSNLNRPLSLRTFLYTVVCWWCMYVFPYKGPGIIENQ